MAKGKSQQQASTTKVTPNAKPDTEDASAKKEKVKKVDYVGTLTAEQKKDPSIYPFKTTPEDFDHDKHKPLKKADFAVDHEYILHKAAGFQHRADKLKIEAEEVKKTGGRKQQAGLKRFKKMQEKIAELKQKLEAQGVDPSVLEAAESDEE